MEYTAIQETLINVLRKLVLYMYHSTYNSTIWSSTDNALTGLGLSFVSRVLGQHRHQPPWFNIKKSSYQYRKSYYGDKTILRLSYLHNGISYTGKTTSLYWIWAQKSYYMTHNVDGFFSVLSQRDRYSPSSVTFTTKHIACITIQCKADLAHFVIYISW